MRFHEITSISGMGGLFRMTGQRPNGLIVHSLAEGWTRFVSSRKHMFTPLDNIAIYTDDDTVPLLDVMLSMREKKADTPLPGAKDSADAFKAYLEAIVPNYDRDKVYVSDMKKLVRWFGILEEHGILEAEIKAKAEGEEDGSKAGGEENDVTSDGDAPADSGNEAGSEAVEPKKASKAQKAASAKKADSK
jgi:hypothetical protein